MNNDTLSFCCEARLDKLYAHSHLPDSSIFNIIPSWPPQNNSSFALILLYLIASTWRYWIQVEIETENLEERQGRFFWLSQLCLFKSAQFISVTGVYWRVKWGSKLGEIPFQSCKARVSHGELTVWGTALAASLHTKVWEPKSKWALLLMRLLRPPAAYLKTLLSTFFAWWLCLVFFLLSSFSLSLGLYLRCQLLTLSRSLIKTRYEKEHE